MTDDKLAMATRTELWDRFLYNLLHSFNV